MATLGVPLASNANPANAVDPGSKANLNPASANPDLTPGDAAVESGKQPAVADTKPSEATAFNQPSTSEPQLTHDVVKLGEQQSQTTNETSAETTIAKVQSHELAGRKAATLYVRNIPILTFLSSGKTASEPVKMGQRQATSESADAIAATKALSNFSPSDVPSGSTSETSPKTLEAGKASTDATSQQDPIWRATAIAAKLNQLNREGVDAKTITVSWNAQADQAKASGERYAIKANNTVIAVIDADTVLPDTTRNLEKDALQATNRLRRLLGNASPLNSVSGKPNDWSQQVAVGSIRFHLSGLASWYGPGFHGSPSASGEPFNQNALTAAHRTLPFGTQVLVTNTNNGQSVVVRINDRGPYAGNRVIDLSTAAARMLGLIQSGVAPVRLDVLDNNPRTITAGN